jgi:subtilisin family serine protease
MNSSRIDSYSVRKFVAGLAAIVFTAGAHAIDIHPIVLAQVQAQGSSDALIVFGDQLLPTTNPALDIKAHRRALVNALHLRADAQQHDLRAWLDARGIEHQDFWIVNAIRARVTNADLVALQSRSENIRIDPNPVVARTLPAPAFDRSEVLDAGGIGWGVAKINAPAMWAAGFTGQNVVIGGEDTGYQWDHPILKPHYRGWNGTVANHNYNWHDAIHNAQTGNPCGSNSPVPCDDDLHGTHTAGTFVGDDGPGASPRHQYGVAPGATWIGCRNMDEGTGTPARYIECMQFMLAPTDLAGNNPNPDLAADIVSNSWSCPTSEGCSADTLETAVNTLVDAGIFYAAAAQNYGPGCSTITDPPALYDAVFDVGATDQSDSLASFSSLGPVAGSTKIRPDVVAPGVDICSSIPTNSYSCTFSGTSMATPHVAGAAALLMSAFPELKGNPARIAAVLGAGTITSGVTDPYNTSCGGKAGTTWPNYLMGYGRIDVYAAFLAFDEIFKDGFDGG